MENIKVDVIPQEESQAILDWLKDWKDKMMSEMEDEVTVPKERLEEYLKEIRIKNIHFVDFKDKVKNNDGE